MGLIASIGFIYIVIYLYLKANKNNINENIKDKYYGQRD